MIRFSENHSLKAHNTFGIDAKAKYYFEFTELEDLEVFLNSNKSWKDEKLIVLGEGSNILFLNDFDGLVIHPNVPGMNSVYEDRQHEWIEVGAGEVWDEFVEFAANQGLGGIENLSLIPGKVGAAPVQNIGAYGQEVCRVVEKVKGFDLKKGCAAEFTADECQFEYRNSIFKNYLKNRFIITSVIFRLEKFPEFDLGYGHLQEKVKAKGEANLQNIREAVIEIRSSKLPDVKELGNAGSFFKNPVVDKKLADQLLVTSPDIPVYPGEEGKYKLAAGWLIEQAGWKGKRIGDAGVHEKQALVLVNYGEASGKEIYALSEAVCNSVEEKFGVTLEREVNCI
ncbi:UDP-N-acetylmuramate dehydrogenase [Draconibacterium halophilum]|uniref:UDP-N-acetylenolpyruvoylglucosamine reductase n=1 Tax=Draconibacterium halophilum TaxID=2706887 RepID=A0A6C0RER7_9BACT|nr:UDP-N-acetylmuramate dehydrogenase [Draconibacterium halophilum]QIA08023.1 UDP-N-acetylmuramate dehydrogenase [Draconibacterium halophilum]